MSFIAKLFMPKMPSLPAITLPETKDVPSYEDEARKKQAEDDERRRALGRKGRQSTILTSAKGLNELSDEEYEQKTLLG
jgi:general stress protein YciG